MDALKRRRATGFLKGLDGALATCECAGARDARASISDALSTLGNNTASFKASDYAIARVHARLARLIGYNTLELSDEAHAAWNHFEDFVYGEARDDLRAVGGPNVG